MILINITTGDENQATEIADFLVAERLVLNAFVQSGRMTRRGDNGKLFTQEQYLILGKTKGLLFEQIDKILRNQYPDSMPALFSVPIVHMDWDQSSELMENTEKV